jgi:adenylate cyclase
MPQEIEIKLALPVRQAPALRRHPLLAGVVPQKQAVRNLYLDTPELDLRRAGLALRRRQIGKDWRLTVKQAGAASNAGLSRRLEWEYALPPDRLDFAPVDAPALRAQLEAAAPRLLPIFRTDFVRQCWRLAAGACRVEVALDLGCIRAGQARIRLHEVELELLEGDEAALQKLAARLAADLPLTPLSASKAARGYALAGGL